MYHSITFGDKNTWDDWHLIPSSRPVIPLPDVKTKYVEVPGRHGSIDVSDILTGFPVYGDRSGSVSFIVDNGHWPWQVAYETISAYLHGQQMIMVLEDDPGYYYFGRFKVDSWQSGKSNSAISISFTLEPFKTSFASSDEDWLWDTFSFETGVIREYKNIEVNGTKTVTVIGSGMPYQPTFTVTGTISAEIDGEEYDLSEGSYQIYGLYIYEGEQDITFTGTGTVTIGYREVRL